jgi:hypothetical protein
MTKTNPRIYYCYVLLDPRKPIYNKHGFSFPHEPFYIGIGHGNRKHVHVKEALTTKKNSIKLNKIRKIIREGYDVIVLQNNRMRTWKEACVYEKQMIHLIGRIDQKRGPLSNLTDGGEGACNPSKKTRIKIGDAFRGKKLSEEHKRKCSIANKGRVLSSGNLGNVCPIETRLKIGKANSIALLGKKQSEETKQKRALANRGQKRSPEFCERMRQHALNRKPPSKETIQKMREAKLGRTLSEETKSKMSKAQLGKKLSPEHCAKIGSVHRGKKVSIETRSKIRESINKYYATIG